MNAFLWTLQALLAALFLFAGGAKLVLPIAEMTKSVPMPGLFLRFIGVAEICGALGLLLPGILKIRTALTTLAAAGLTIIVVGATVVTLLYMPPAQAIFPLITGLLAAFVAYGRWRLSPLPARL